MAARRCACRPARADRSARARASERTRARPTLPVTLSLLRLKRALQPVCSDDCRRMEPGVRRFASRLDEYFIVSDCVRRSRRRTVREPRCRPELHALAIGRFLTREDSPLTHMDFRDMARTLINFHENPIDSMLLMQPKRT